MSNSEPLTSTDEQANQEWDFEDYKTLDNIPEKNCETCPEGRQHCTHCNKDLD